MSQQTITACKVGRWRIQVSTLPLIAQALGVIVEALDSLLAQSGR